MTIPSVAQATLKIVDFAAGLKYRPFKTMTSAFSEACFTQLQKTKDEGEDNGKGNSEMQGFLRCAAYNARERLRLR